MYLPGDAVLITDIGESSSLSVSNSGESLVCVTTNVNTQCCRDSDGPRGKGGNAGEWYFPNGTIVPRRGGGSIVDFTRSGFTHQVRLNHKRSAMSPTGMFECRVPGRDGAANASALISIGQCCINLLLACLRWWL